MGYDECEVLVNCSSILSCAVTRKRLCLPPPSYTAKTRPLSLWPTSFSIGKKKWWRRHDIDTLPALSLCGRCQIKQYELWGCSMLFSRTRRMAISAPTAPRTLNRVRAVMGAEINDVITGNIINCHLPTLHHLYIYILLQDRELSTVWLKEGDQLFVFFLVDLYIFKNFSLSKKMLRRWYPTPMLNDF